ncbi:MAG TPA: GNAT family N-acetyltransferase [Candidatus Dormibacteraeota bacterium]|nr:GNAT family N-acetyltransferase [Candidatus Dormibacteraeota bacterium]
MQIERVADSERWTPSLAAMLVEVVAGGASLGFVEPFDVADAVAWWPGFLATAIVLVARDGDELVGTVSLALAMPANGAHRAELRKLMVKPSARRRGIGAALVAAAEDEARGRARTLIVLDTVSGSGAEHLYRSLGYVEAGVIPGYARAPRGEVLESTTVFYKRLDPLQEDGDELAAAHVEDEPANLEVVRQQGARPDPLDVLS